jgi:hypothetical protein
MHKIIQSHSKLNVSLLFLFFLFSYCNVYFLFFYLLWLMFDYSKVYSLLFKIS